MRPFSILLSLGLFTLCLGCSSHQDFIGEPLARESPPPVVMGRSGDAPTRPTFARSGTHNAVLAHDSGQIQEQMVLGDAPCLLSGAVVGEGDAASIQVESVHLLEAPGSIEDAGQPREAMCH
jgi:hypothetical protein